jgi:hypothetical protein
MLDQQEVACARLGLQITRIRCEHLRSLRGRCVRDVRAMGLPEAAGGVQPAGNGGGTTDSSTICDMRKGGREGVEVAGFGWALLQRKFCPVQFPRIRKDTTCMSGHPYSRRLWVPWFASLCRHLQRRERTRLLSASFGHVRHLPASKPPHSLYVIGYILILNCRSMMSLQTSCLGDLSSV